jgi:hypothetical protein
MKYWEIIADNLSKSGWSWGCVSVGDSNGRTIFVVTRIAHDGTAHWVEVCFCRTPLEEERPYCYWEEYFDLISVKDAHARRNCRDLNGTEPWAYSECDCTHHVRMIRFGKPIGDAGTKKFLTRRGIRQGKYRAPLRLPGLGPDLSGAVRSGIRA